jgi:hypothetical protein
VAAGAAGQQGHAEAAGDLVPHLRRAGARQQEGDRHLRALDHHFRRQPSGGVEHLVAAVHAVQPHFSGNRIDRIMAAHVFDKIQQRAGLREQGASVYRAGLLVDRLQGADGFDDPVYAGLP